MVLDTSSVYDDARRELEQRPEDYHMETGETDRRFHGTIMEAGERVLEEGVLEPGSETAAGENPQDVVCGTYSFATALVYAEEGTPAIDERLNAYVNEMVEHSYEIDAEGDFDLRKQADRARFAEQTAAMEPPYGGVEGHLAQLGDRIMDLPGIDRTPMVVAFDDADGVEESNDEMIVAMDSEETAYTNNEVWNHQEADLIAEERYDMVDLSDATFYVPHERMDELDEAYPDRTIRSLEAQQLAHRKAMADVYAEEGRLEYSPVYTGDRPMMFDAELTDWDGETISGYTGDH